MSNFAELKRQMIEYQMVARGLHDEAVLNAMSAVPREKFVPSELVEFAYHDAPLPLAAQQTIPQPYIAALMVSALQLESGDNVVEVGTGFGYGAAIIAEIADKVYSIERHKILADSARQRLRKLGYENIQVLFGDGTLGWPKKAPFDAIVVAAGGPEIPPSLLQQLAIGGRLVIPVGCEMQRQSLLRIRRISKDEYQQEDLGGVHFVPLIGASGWEEERPKRNPKAAISISAEELIFQSSEPFTSPAEVCLDKLLQRIGDSSVVLLGEASHGSAEFCEMRARISQELIEKKGFNIVAVEADWPDSNYINHYIHGTSPDPRLKNAPFSLFPSWMWANQSMLKFTQWLQDYNATFADNGQSAGFYGLDLYSFNSSIEAVLSYLDSVDPTTAQQARVRYGRLTPWAKDPTIYGQAILTKQYKRYEKEVLAILRNLLKSRLNYAHADGQRYFSTEQNARLIADAEGYYKTLYYAEQDSWSQRDQHMFDTLQSILSFHGKDSKVIIWGNNSHIGDARATQMSARGEFNLGQLVREQYQRNAYSIGFGTDHGTVAAASEWGGPMEIKTLQPAHADSYEGLCHKVATNNFLLPLSKPIQPALRKRLLAERLERSVGAIYRPESELQNHYFHTCLPQQFDEYIWFDETRAVEPLNRVNGGGLLANFPFGVCGAA
jgi:protein-L-isoaspartate(D-aspartate) O-methyltransferase